MKNAPINRTMLVRNVLRIRPDATPAEARAIMPALADVPEAELQDWLNQARRAIARQKGGGAA